MGAITIDEWIPLKQKYYSNRNFHITNNLNKHEPES